jgi:ppGpp synthetase/RelA/SpoT-type nucleotidyltranferase
VSPALVILAADLMATLAHALLQPYTREVDEQVAALLGHAFKLRTHLEEVDEAARETYLDALELLMAAAQKRIRAKPEG